ncbi:glycosyltransferase family 4 protein [Nocardiopsis sp. JB363]|uniref:glycosyltransferase family 4 protein n=1 Tax=Nocardiopsis sp. JB363 TaxID=1434837 RepID=UPI00097B3C39|nr:glycosyltransferase family 4 protein [Nocardiopsis sp. JB363]SIO84474.1 Glycosyl transferase, group 1 [Nocardiopsis sp. JB363]
MTIPFLIPASSTPSGGTLYDLRIARAGAGLRIIRLPGAWPRPDPREVRALERALDLVPDGGRVLLDGLVACALPEVIVPRAHRLRLVVLVHLPLAQESGLDPDTARDLDLRERRVLGSCALVVATGQWAARHLSAHHDLPRVAVVPPGVAAAPLARGTAPDRSPPRLLCVASLTPRKGHRVLFEALEHLTDLDWECVCVGPGRPLPAPAGVRFTGPLHGADLDAAYDRADLLVLPSLAETYGMVVTEALARGVPVMASAVGGVPEALGGSGISVAPGAPEEWARELRIWLSEPRTRHRWRVRARARRTELRGWDEAARALRHVLEQA